jgi:hypothetical protein
VNRFNCPSAKKNFKGVVDLVSKKAFFPDA